MSRTALAPELRTVVGDLGSADLMVGIPSHRNAATIGYVVRAAQAGLVQYFPELSPVLVNSDAGSADGTSNVVVETEPPDYVERILLVRPRNRLRRVSLRYPDVDGVGGKGAALRALFGIAAELGVDALVVVDSDLRSILPEWIELLAGPILKGGYDFVAPRYERHKYDATITNTVTYPLTRALYGRRIRQPIGGDFGVSGDLIRHYLAQKDWTPEVSRFGIDIWMTTHAITGGFAVCEARLGAKVHDPKDPGADLGPMFRQVVATTLRLAAANSEHWLRIGGSHEVPAYGFERVADVPPLGVNAARVLGEFARRAELERAGWDRLLAPETAAAVASVADAAREVLAEAERRFDGAIVTQEISATRVRRGDVTTEDVADALAGFHFPDDVWARTIYDLIVAARRDPDGVVAIVDALVPIYFGRVASLVVENRAADPVGAEEVVERQALEFELRKPYLVERWLDVANGTASR